MKRKVSKVFSLTPRESCEAKKALSATMPKTFDDEVWMQSALCESAHMLSILFSINHTKWLKKEEKNNNNNIYNKKRTL